MNQNLILRDPSKEKLLDKAERLILVQQKYCLDFFRHQKYSRKTAVKFDMSLLIDT